MTFDRRGQYEAYKAVKRARYHGELVPGVCAHGGDCAGRLEAHHHDYAVPLDVLWLCNRHHREFHQKAKAVRLHDKLAQQERVA